MRLVVPVRLRYLELELGALYKNFRSVPGTLLWILEDGCLYLGDVSPHQSLLAIGSLIREQCPPAKYKSKLRPLIKKMSPELARLATPIVAAGGCTMDGSDVTTSPGAFGIGDMTLTPAIEAEIGQAAVKHFTAYNSPPDTSAFFIPKN